MPEAAGVFSNVSTAINTPSATEPVHPLETMVAEMMDPAISDTKRGEYEWSVAAAENAASTDWRLQLIDRHFCSFGSVVGNRYTLYQSHELLSSTETAEPQDLQLYALSADLARGALPQTQDEATIAYEKYIYGGSVVHGGMGNAGMIQGRGGLGGNGHGEGIGMGDGMRSDNESD